MCTPCLASVQSMDNSPDPGRITATQIDDSIAFGGRQPQCARVDLLDEQFIGNGEKRGTWPPRRRRPERSAYEIGDPVRPRDGGGELRDRSRHLDQVVGSVARHRTLSIIGGPGRFIDPTS